MKNKNVILSAAKNLLLIALLATGCTDRFEHMNTNPNQVTARQMEVKNYRTGTKVTNLQNIVVPVQEHLYQFVECLAAGPYAGYVGEANTWQNRFSTFNEEQNWRKAPFTDVLTQLYAPYRAILSESDDEVVLAFAHLMRVAIIHRVTDCYGPVPHSDIIKNEGLFIKYDSQEDVYRQLFEELDLAISAFKANEGLDPSGWTAYDKVYYGNMAQWHRFANSLKLRMAMRLSYVKPELAKEKAAEAIAAGVIETNADNAFMHASENRAALIYNGWNDHRVAADILSYMNGYEDPRREKMFTSVGTGDEKVFAGVRVGCVVDRERFIPAYSNLLISTDTPYLWMNAAETTFLRSEYELRWGSAETAKQLYEQAITLSFEEKGASGSAEYIADNTKMPEAYTDPLGAWSVSTRPSTVTVAWDDAATDIEVNLEKIITQKWIAIFPLGVEGWSEYRRTGYPKLFDAAQDLSGGAVNVKHHARRLRYPVEEGSQNKENYLEAVSILNREATGDQSLSGDEYSTRLWWDVKPFND